MMTQQDYAAKQAAARFAADALIAANPHLVAVSAKVDGLMAAAKNIRIELARAFPGVKFSVKSSRFSMGDSIRINWIDGPTTAQVEAIVNRYEAGSFDGSTDCYNYRGDRAFTDAFGDAKFVQTSREYSDRTLANVMAILDFAYQLPDWAFVLHILSDPAET
jgi:hypothetical protein